jgi:hypothetical protein
MIKGRIIQHVFDRYMRWRLNELLRPSYLVELDYAIDPRPRYGYGKPPHPLLTSIIGEGRVRYRELLTEFLRFDKPLRRIPATQPLAASANEPFWMNKYFSGLDAVALYGLLTIRNPARYFEIGSGNSTKFARRAIRDQSLRTKITSCDPAPRADIDDLCDLVIRSSAEELPLSAFDELESGDILFVDNSHRSFMNSDATVVFLDVLPRLKKGTLVHVHDIFLPYDYPPTWAHRHYSEQYLLACLLLAEGRKWKILMPNSFVSLDEELAALTEPLWSQDAMRAVYDQVCEITLGFQGVSFWMEVI